MQEKAWTNKEKHNCYPLFWNWSLYAQTLIVVNLIVVNFFGCLVIEKIPRSVFGENWGKFFLQSSRTFLNQNVWNQTVGKPKFRGQNFRVHPENFNDYLHLRFERICFFEFRFRGYRKVREACRKNFHLVAPLKTSVARFYDQKTKKVHDY